MLIALYEKHKKYLELIKTVQDESGFIQSDECDSLIFSGLVGSVPGVSVNITDARDNEGMWHRRPTHLPSCYDGTPNATTISRDMLMGLAWFTWKNKRLDISEQVVKYALKHYLIMGKSVSTQNLFAKCMITPGLLATYAEISYRLGGPNRWWLRWIPQIESKSVKGFQAHLCMLHCILRKELTGKLPQRIEDVVIYHAQREPKNPLFQYAVENYADACSVLLDSSLWPAETLPTRNDRKEPWLLQRDYGTDWQPSQENPQKIHSGGDFLFVSSLVLQKIGGT